jgi:hypothetical protein
LFIAFHACAPFQYNQRYQTCHKLSKVIDYGKVSFVYLPERLKSKDMTYQVINATAINLPCPITNTVATTPKAGKTKRYAALKAAISLLLNGIISYPSMYINDMLLCFK